MTLLARLAPRATKATVSSISSDGTFLVAPWWNQLLGWVPTRAGTTIDEQSALALPIVYACVRVIAESIASLPLITYRRTPEGGKERATDNPYYSLFHDAPNPAMTSFGWRETLMTHLTTWGNGYNEITETGFGTEVWPLPPHRMEVGWEAGHKVFDYLADDGQKKRLDSKRVWHIPGLSTNGLVGLSPIQAHRESLGEMLATRDFGSSFYRNNARPAAVLEHPATLSAGAIERLATQMDQLRGTGNAGKTIVMEEGMKLHEVGVPPEDAQYIETRKLQREDVCSIYRMPPHMVGVLDHATFSNIEHQSIDFVVHTLRPWLVRIEQSIKAFFLADQPDIFVEFLVDGLLRGDAEARSKALAVQLEHEAITVNEWREIENRNPYPVNIRWTPAANYLAEEIDEDGNLVQPEAPALPAAAEPTAPPTSPPQLTVIKSAAVRCAHERNGVPCNRLLAEVATPPYTLVCPRCKGVTRSTETKAADNVEAVGRDELKSALLEMADAISLLAGRQGELMAVGESMRSYQPRPPTALRIVRNADGGVTIGEDDATKYAGQPRDPKGRFGSGGHSGAGASGSAGGAGEVAEPSAEARGLASEVRGRAEEAETGISADVKAASGSGETSYAHAMTGAEPPANGDLAGYENRLKGEGSLARKIRDDAADRGQSERQTAEGIGDSVRYTQRLPEASYTAGVESTMAGLRAKGHVMVAAKPTWDSDVYRGYNTNWRAPGGHVYELQFHTAKSFVTKETNHPEYEKWRLPSTSAREKKRLGGIMADRARTVSQPPGWERLPTLKREY